MQRHWLRVGLAVCAAGLVLGTAAPAFGDDAPVTTTEPTTTTTEPVTTTTTTTTAPDVPVPTADAPDAPVTALAPSLTVTPSTNLPSFQSVTIAGSGFTPNVSVGFAECKNNHSGDAADCDTTHSGFSNTDGSGAFSASFTVRRMLHTGNGVVDCAAAPGTCNIGAAKISDYTETAGAPLTFDPNAPIPPPPTLSVTPNTGLLYKQSVTVTGSGFTPNISVGWAECKNNQSGNSADCDIQHSGFATTDGSGAFSASFTTRRMLHTGNGVVDCAAAPETCSVGAANVADYAETAGAPLTFDPNAPIPPLPTISVTPNTNLVEGQSVTVMGTNFEPSAIVFLSQCTSSSQPAGFCPSAISSTSADATGAFTAAFTVRRGVYDFFTFPPAVVDCASAPQTCVLNAFNIGGDDIAAQALDFDASVPIPVPVVTVSPQTDLPDRGVVHVHGTGFGPGDRVLVQQCVAGAPEISTECDRNAGPEVHADATGAIDTTFRVHRDLPFSDGAFIFADGPDNCASGYGTCVIRTRSLDNPLVTADVPLGFDPTAVAPPPVLTTVPAGPFVDGQQIEVHGAGFMPEANVVMAQCQANVDPQTRPCDSGDDGHFAAFVAGADGTFTHTFTVHAELPGATGPIDCTVSGSCVLFAANIRDYDVERTDLPLVFGEFVAPARTLAFTGAGAATVPTAALGFGLLLVGAALVLLARRRAPAA